MQTTPSSSDGASVETHTDHLKQDAEEICRYRRHFRKGDCIPSSLGLSTHPQLQKKTLPIADKAPPLAPVNQPRPRPSKPPANSPTSQSPTRVTGFSDPQTSSLSSLRQTANQAAGSDRSLGKTQLLPPSSIKSSSSLSTKARIATDMAKGPLNLGQSKLKYQGLSMRKNANSSGESRSPVMPLTANPQSPLESPQRTLLPRPSNEPNNQPQVKAASLPQRSPPPPPPPQLEELFHDLELEQDHMDVDLQKFVNLPHCCHSSNPLQPAHRLHHPDRRIL
jgi:hypothetical protein